MKKLIIIILATLAFTVCNTDSNEDNKPDPIINPGDTSDNPIIRTESLQLTTMAWVELLNEIETVGKYVALDLSACTRGNQTAGGGLWSDGSFYPDPAIPSFEKGKNKIVNLILPEAATNIPDVYLYTDSTGEHYSPSFRYFSNLKNVTGINITTIGRNAFENLGTYTGTSVSGDTVVIRNGILANINFPNVTTINQNAFLSCFSLIKANIPKVKIIQGGAFQWTNLQDLHIPDVTYIGVQAFMYTNLTEIILGKIAPSVEYLVHSKVGTVKNVTLKVPMGAIGYGDIPNLYIGGDKTKNWANAFRGMAWNPAKANTTIPDPFFKYDSEGYGPTDYINTSLILRIEYIH